MAGSEASGLVPGKTRQAPARINAFESPVDLARHISHGLGEQAKCLTLRFHLLFNGLPILPAEDSFGSDKRCFLHRRWILAVGEAESRANDDALW
jgi:hypothetical protein